MISFLTRLLLLAAVITSLHEGSQSFAQQRPRATPTMLLGPDDWRFERLPIPPGFAREITWTGYEEARFSPGMFDTASATYFSYVLAVQLDGSPTIHAAELKDFLDKYFKGLSLMVGKRKNLTPDPALFGAEVVTRKGEADTSGKFSAKVPMFDTFNDGRKVLLNMEIDVVPKPDTKKTILKILISPKPSDDPIWTQLHDILSKIQEP